MCYYKSMNYKQLFMTTKVTTIRLPEKLLESLDRLAEDELISRADIIRRAVQQYLKGVQ